MLHANVIYKLSLIFVMIFIVVKQPDAISKLDPMSI